jgi:hypothetical protein
MSVVARLHSLGAVEHLGSSFILSAIPVERSLVLQMLVIFTTGYGASLYLFLHVLNAPLSRLSSFLSDLPGRHFGKHTVDRIDGTPAYTILGSTSQASVIPLRNSQTTRL